MRDCSENDSVLNRLGEWLWEQYWKDQPIGVKIKVEVKTDQTNQPIKPTIDQSIKPSTDQLISQPKLRTIARQTRQTTAG